LIELELASIKRIHSCFGTPTTAAANHKMQTLYFEHENTGWNCAHLATSHCCDERLVAITATRAAYIAKNQVAQTAANDNGSKQATVVSHRDQH
jgi:hypothetical protein